MPEINTQEHILFDFEITEAVYLKLWDFSLFKSQNPKRKKMTLLILLVVLTPAPMLFNLIYYGLIYGNFLYLLDLFDWLLALIPLLLGARVFYRWIYQGKKLYRKYPAQHAHVSADFGPDGFSISAISSISQTHSELRYDVIQKAYETKTAFYLYPNKTTAYIVEKSGLIQGNLTSLRLHLQKALKKNYILCK